MREIPIYCVRDLNNRGYYIRLFPHDSRMQSGSKRSGIYSCALAIVMMMRWRWIERKKKELGEGRTSKRGTEKETRKNKSKKMISIREAAVCVDALDSSRVHMCNGRAAARLYNTPWFIFAPHFALWGPHTFGYTSLVCYSLSLFPLRMLVLPRSPDSFAVTIRHSSPTFPSSSRLREGPIKQL